MKIYIVWNIKEDRPAIMRQEFGNLVAFLTKEQAQAYHSNFGGLRENFELKEFEIKK